MNQWKTIAIACLLGSLLACNSTTRPAEAAAESTGEAAEQESPAADEAAGEEAVDGASEPTADAPAEAEPAANEPVPPIGSETTEEILAAFPGDGTLSATIVTSMGTLNCELYEDRAPNTVANFVGLASGLKTYLDSETRVATRGQFFDGLIFHRVIPQFMIQGGDPTGTGRGDPGYRFEDEFDPTLRHDRGGLLSMANSGPNTNGSQFFVTEVATPHLNDRHAIFGACAEVELVERMARVPTGAASRPLQDLTIESLRISRN
ncbi:MAG: peptidyl-prolyl cis-trans isomerase A (cyclophilin A) [Bradymonadia bacterium]|jgi:peptidyl-prolyl cis-trans isomerase A (cyclophilin A)